MHCWHPCGISDQHQKLCRQPHDEQSCQLWLQMTHWFRRRRFLYPRSPKGEGGILFYLCLSVRPRYFFVAFFSVTVDGRNLIFGHKHHIGIPYCGQCFWTRQIPTSCLPTQLVFIHIEHICSFFVAFFSVTIDGRNLIFGHKLHIGTPYRGKRF